MALPPKAAFDPALASEWNELITRLTAAENAHSTLDAVRITTVAAYLTTSTDPTEATKLRSAAVTVLNGKTYRFSGQTLYTAADPWALEIHKNSTAGSIVGGARLEASGAGATVSWNIDWACPATETGIQFYYVFNRLSGTGALNLFGVNDGFHNTFSKIDLVGAASLLRDVA